VTNDKPPGSATGNLLACWITTYCSRKTSWHALNKLF